MLFAPGAAFTTPITIVGCSLWLNPIPGPVRDASLTLPNAVQLTVSESRLDASVGPARREREPLRVAEVQCHTHHRERAAEVGRERQRNRSATRGHDA